MSGDGGYWGTLRGMTAQSKFNELWYVVNSIINRRATATLVQVVKCTNTDEVSPVGFVDVQPLVHQLDGSGNIMPHGVVYGLPYLRLQGGAAAVIIDPKPGDIGLAVFASQDISKVKSTKKAAAPGSQRRMDMADGLYLGGVLNGTPTSYVRFTDSAIEVVDPNQITLRAPTITLDGDVEGTAGATFTDDVVANGISADSHVHSDPQGGDTGPPT